MKSQSLHIMCFPAYCDSAPPSQPLYAYNTTTRASNQLGQLITYNCFTGSNNNNNCEALFGRDSPR